MSKRAYTKITPEHEARLLNAADIQHLPRVVICEMFGITPTALPGQLKRARARRYLETFAVDHQRIAERIIAEHEEVEYRRHDLGDVIDDFMNGLGIQGADDLEALAQASLRAFVKIDPIITHAGLTFPDDKPIAIRLMGCLQIGGRHTSHRLIREAFDELGAHERIYAGMFGDEIENFKSGSFAGGRSVMEQSLPVPLQYALWENLFESIAPKVLWGMSSQHGSMWDEKQGLTPAPIKRHYTDRSIPYFDGMGYINLQVGQQTYRLAVAHEFPGNSQYNKLHPHKRALWQRYPNADLIAQADKHSYAVAEESIYGNEFEAGNRPSQYVHMVQIGTAKIGADPYTLRGWEPGFFGWPYAVFFPDRHLIKITRHLDDVLHWLGK